MNVFPRVLMPSLVDIGATAWRMSLDGTLFRHLSASVIRLLVGFLVGAAAGVGLGMLMGQSRRAENSSLPLLSALMPIPSLAWIPLFILWFGLGDAATMAVIIFSVVLPVAFNTWTGVKSANPVWVKAAESMGCHGRKLFFAVVLPGSLSTIFTGLRIGLSQGWRALVAGEMLSSPEWGMGFAIFDSRQFLATDVMLVMVMCIGLTGFLIVTVLFGYVERAHSCPLGDVAGGWSMTAALSRRQSNFSLQENSMEDEVPVQTQEKSASANTLGVPFWLVCFPAVPQ